MADLLDFDDDADDGADEPVNGGHAGGVEGAAERDYQVVRAPPNSVHGVDDDSDEEVRGPEDAAGRGTRRRLELLEPFIPSSGGGGVSEQDAVLQAFEGLAGFSDRNSRVNYPARGEPLREKPTPWLASMRLVVLFLLGVGDPFHVGRPRRVPLSNGITYLMTFADRPPPVDGVPQAPNYQFAIHRTFRYWCLDAKMRRQANEQCRLFLRQNQEQVQVPVEDITEEELRQMMVRAVRYIANVSGTDGYGLAQQGHLEDGADQLPSLTAFTTYSAADHDWYNLHRLLPRATEEPRAGDDADVRDICCRDCGLIDNPHLAD